MNQKKPKYVWRIANLDGLSVVLSATAYTKSEARSLFKESLGRLPAGTKIEKGEKVPQ